MYIFIGKKNNFYEIKFDSNCKQEEKNGTGPGSCSGNTNDTNTYSDVKKIYDKTYSDYLNSLHERNKYSRSDPKFEEQHNKMMIEANKLDNATFELKRTIGKIAPDSEYTNKLNKIQLDSSNKLRQSSNKVFRTASKFEIHAIEGNIIASDFESDLLRTHKIPVNIENIGNILENVDANINEIGSIPEVREYVRKVYGFTEQSFKKMVKDSSGGLKDEYITENTYNAYYGRYANALANIKHMDNIIDRSTVPEDIETYSGMSISQFPTGLKVGDEFSYNGFLSTSRLPNVAKGFARMKHGLLAKINIKQGSKALAVEDFISNNPKYFQDEINKENGGSWIIGESGKKDSGGNQREVLLPRNQKFKVIKIKNNNIELETI